MRRCSLSHLRIISGGIAKQTIQQLKTFQIIRHNIHYSRKCFSSSPLILNCLPSFSTTENPKNSPNNLLFKRINEQMDQNDYDQAISFLKGSSVRLEPPQILHIIQRLSKKRKFIQLKQVYDSYKGEILKHTGLLVTMMDSSYLEKNYILFEELFKHYMETQYLTAYYFNMALKVFLHSDPLLSKEILFQMSCFQYPMNDDTIYEYLVFADRFSNFNTIRFVYELIKKNPNIPIDDRAYGFLVECYLRNASTSLEVSELMEFLATRNVDELIEVKMAIFLKNIESMDITSAWTEFHQFKTQNIYTKDKLQRLYNKFYSQFQSRMNWNDMTIYLENYKKDGLKDSKILFKSMISHTDNEVILLDLLKDLTRKTDIDYYLLKDTWKRLIEIRPDFAYEITLKFDDFLNKNLRAHSWVQNVLNDMTIVKISNSRANRYKIKQNSTETENDRLIVEITKLLSKEADTYVIGLLNGIIRDGKKIHFEVLLFALNGLIKMGSKKSYLLYELIHQIYKCPPINVELIWLNRSVMKQREFKSICAVNEVKEFQLKYANRLGYKDYNRLASYLIDLRSYDTAVGYLLEAKKLIRPDEAWGNISIFVLLLKTLLWKKDLKHFTQLMSVIVKEENISISKYSLMKLHHYKKHILNNQYLEKEAKDEFEKNFNDAMVGIKQRYVSQRETFLTKTDEIINVFGDWIASEEHVHKG